jgi:hypothetical protein
MHRDGKCKHFFPKNVKHPGVDERKNQNLSYRNRVRRCGLDSSDSGQGSVARPYDIPLAE